MSSERWKNTAEMIGVVAIIASVLFVGMELRQSRQIATAVQYQERMRTGFDYFVVMSENEVWLERNAQNLRDRYDLTELSAQDRDLLTNGTPQQIGKWFVVAEINMLIFDNYHLQYLSGVSTDEAWLAQRDRLKYQFKINSFARQQVKTGPSRYRASFVEVANQLIDEIEAQEE